MRLYSIEGTTQKLDGGAMFGNAPKAMWSKWITPDAQNRIPLSARALLVICDDGKKVLFEAGVGAFFEPKLKERYGITENTHVLIESLQKIGLSDADIDIVVLSHLHFDHAGGILSAYGDGPLRLLFPNALFYTGKEQFLRAQKPHPRDKASYIPELQELLLASKRLHLLDSKNLSFCSFEYFHGHTPGLIVSTITTPKGPLIFVSDLIPGLAWVHASLSMGYDRYAELVIDEKTSFLEKNEGSFLFFTHDPVHPCAKLSKDSSGKYIASPQDLKTLYE